MRRSKTFDAWKEMKPAAVRRLAFAAFLMFGILGPLVILMDSRLETMSWQFIVIQTVACGGMAATIVIFGRKKWWLNFLIVAFWSLILVMNRGAVSIGYFDNEGLRVHLGIREKDELHPPPQEVILSPSEQNALFTQRTFVGLFAVFLLAFGYVSFTRVMRAEVKYRARLETEVKIAQDIQRSLLPSAMLQTPRCSVAGVSIPASEVGGDYYDFVQLDDGRMAIAIADVAGHGIGAGLLSAMTKSALHLQLQHDPAPAAVLKNLNTTIYEVSEEKDFVTFGYLLFDAGSNTMRAATAGHPPLLYKRAGTNDIQQIRTVSLGLGLRQNTEYADTLLTTRPGDMILLYTDGIPEAANSSGEQFGAERLEKLFQTSTGSADEICSIITEALRKFSSGEGFQDDVSLICVKMS